MAQELGQRLIDQGMIREEQRCTDVRLNGTHGIWIREIAVPTYEKR